MKYKIGDSFRDATSNGRGIYVIEAIINEEGALPTYQLFLHWNGKRAYGIWLREADLDVRVARYFKYIKPGGPTGVLCFKRQVTRE